MTTERARMLADDLLARAVAHPWLAGLTAEQVDLAMATRTMLDRDDGTVLAKIVQYTRRRGGHDDYADAPARPGEEDDLS